MVRVLLLLVQIGGGDGQDVAVAAEGQGRDGGGVPASKDILRVNLDQHSMHRITLTSNQKA